ncbi:hypothetical protein EDB19DRAFT_1839175 [Suillus lakei]|nr:hypothetical protein EDB19DRAFT_1839175 [Suillus lakei]
MYLEDYTHDLISLLDLLCPKYWKVPMWEASDVPTTGVSVSQTQAEQSARDLPPPRRLNRDNVVKNTNASSKRKAEDDGESAAKQAKTTDMDADGPLDVTVQTGLYAAEMFVLEALVCKSGHAIL